MRRPAVLLTGCLCIVAGLGPARAQTARSAPGASYEATIRRTSYGIPHIVAKDLGSLGFGEGYAFAQDHLCSMADQVVRARGERAKYFGRGDKDSNLNSDVAMKAIRVAELGAEDVRKGPPEVRDWLSGYAAGYNSYLAKVTPAGVAGWCRGEAWVRPITAEDVAARGRLVILTLPAFASMIATAAPPQTGAAPADVELPDLDAALSNGWAIGKERSETRRGMLLANPHYPWVGANRFWEKHLTVPGLLDVYGVGLLGIPGVAIGFNRHVAWTHTVSAGARYTGYALKLVPGQPTSYVYDGRARAMTSREVTVEVRQADGTLTTVPRVVYFSHHGPVINFPGLPWTTERAIAVRDANADNDEALQAWLAMGRAASLDDLKRAQGHPGGIPFVNTIAASDDGRALYVDASSAPYLSAETIASWRARLAGDEDTRAASTRNLMLLDGSDSRSEWVSDVRARDPGIVPVELAPQVERTDYVFNANDSYWISNARAPLTGFSPVHGSEATPRSLRTRMNARLLDDPSPSGPAGADGRFSLEEAAAAAFSNRSMSAELLKAALVARCRATPERAIENRTVSLTTACGVLGAWNGTYDLDSRGAVLWREFVTQFRGPDFTRAGKLFARDFDPADPLGTPRELARADGGEDPALDALARAVLVLDQAGLRVDAPLGQVQAAERGGKRIPIHGDLGGEEGIANFVNFAPNDSTLEPDAPQAEAVAGSRYLTRAGYRVNRGSSFVMVLAFTDRGPRARALLTYGQSGDPQSPHFSDQTELFSRKAWREVLFTEEQILADPNLRTEVVSGGR